MNKISIVEYKDTINLLNEKKEFIGKYRHQNKYVIYQIIFTLRSSSSNLKRHSPLAEMWMSCYINHSIYIYIYIYI